VVALFDTAIDSSGAYLSEDYAFCRRVRAAGMQVWLVPWIELAHVGNMAFTGSIPEIARLAATLPNAET
jgi:GT2 family glycosyltransferase